MQDLQERRNALKKRMSKYKAPTQVSTPAPKEQAKPEKKQFKPKGKPQFKGKNQKPMKKLPTFRVIKEAEAKLLYEKYGETSFKAKIICKKGRKILEIQSIPKAYRYSVRVDKLSEEQQRKVVHPKWWSLYQRVTAIEDIIDSITAEEQ